MSKRTKQHILIMCNINHLITAVIILMAISGLSAGDWNGFHGLEKEGRCDSSAGPLNWSSSQNVVWKTVIPGRGHSSPILSGNNIYLTTTYESSRFFQTIWNYILFALALLFTITGISFAMKNLRAKQRKKERTLQHVRFFVFTMFLIGVMIVAFFGRRLLYLDDYIERYWLISIMLVLSCLMLSLLYVPLKSRQQLVASLLSCAYSIAVFITLKHKGFVFAFGSLEGLIIIAALLSPLFFGLILLTAHFLSRRWQSPMIQAQDDTRPTRPIIWHFMIMGSLGFIAALTPFFLLLYRAAGYQMPDSFIWDDLVRPDISWWCIGFYIILVVVTITGCYWKTVRGRVAKRFPLQAVFFAAALSLGAAFFIRIGFVEKPKEFIRAIVSLSRDSGEILWISEGLVGQQRGRSRTVTYASATPVTDGERIYGYFGEDGLICVSPKGELFWKKTEPLFQSKFGLGTSPVVKDNVLIIVSDVRESENFLSSITVFDCVSGKRIWKKERKSHNVDAAYSTPLVKSLNGRQVVIVHGWYDIKGYDLKTGQEVWSYPMTHEGKHLVASLVFDIERLYVVGAKQIRALELSKLGTDSDPLVWSRPIAGEKSSTPVVIGGLMFLVTEPGMAFCVDAQTGEILWKKRLKGRYYSSVIMMGNQVLFTNEYGQTTIVAVSREFRQLAENTLDESVYASFAPVGSQLFVRTTKYLYCIQEDK